MSLYGYRPKGRKAPWTMHSKALKTAQDSSKRRNSTRRRIARKTPPSGKFARINSISDKRRAEKRIYRVKRQHFLDRNPVCAKCKRIIPRELRTVHHMRGRTGKLYLDERWWLMLDINCHRWVTDNPKESIELGLTGGPGEWDHWEPA